MMRREGVIECAASGHEGVIEFVATGHEGVIECVASGHMRERLIVWLLGL